MFTGLIEEVGAVGWICPTDGGSQLGVVAPKTAIELREGDSVAINGCCLTAINVAGDNVAFDLLQETLARTNLGSLQPGSPVNLERALAANGRLGGHFVQGHVDTAARALSFARHGTDYRLEVELPAEFVRYIIPKGSIALNGISLTVAELLPASFVVWIIPHTRQETNLADLRANDLLNIEFDLIAKYVERMTPRKADG
jgi:riboflavin synthase